MIGAKKTQGNSPRNLLKINLNMQYFFHAQIPFALHQ